MTTNPRYPIRRWSWRVLVLLAVAAAFALGGCSSSDDETSTPPAGDSTPLNSPSLNLGLPQSVTGAPVTTTGTAGTMLARPLAGGGDSCSYEGANESDPFGNGYRLTRFLTAQVAGWTCIADNIRVSVEFLASLGFLPTNNTYVDVSEPGQASDEPTGIRVNADGPITSVRMYWGTGNMTTPSLYLAWGTASGSTQGRLVIDASALNPPTIDGATNLDYDPEAPTDMAADFTFGTDGTRSVNMVMAFDAGNAFADAFRIQAARDTGMTWEIKGLIEMKDQWDTNWDSVTYPDVPVLKMYTVADASGQGAAVARMESVGLRLVLSEIDGTPDNLGTFLFHKDDTYYFTPNASGPGVAADYIDKLVTEAWYLGDQAIDSGMEVTSVADVDTYLSSAVAGYTGTPYASCTASPTGASSDANCVTFVNALFSNGDFGAEANTGALPAAGDWRRTYMDAVSAASYLTGPCPDGNAYGSCSWDSVAGGVFEMGFSLTP